MIKFLSKYFTGNWTIPIGNKFLLFPKLAPLFTLALITAFIGDLYDVLGISIIGWLLIALSIFCFFINRLFPNIK